MQGKENIRVRTWMLIKSHAMWGHNWENSTRTNRNFNIITFQGNDFNQYI